MNENLKKLIELGYQHTSEIMIGSTKKSDDETTLLTTFLLQKENDHCDFVATPWADQEQKQAMVMGVSLEIVASEPRVVAYSFLSECWTSYYGKDEVPRSRGEPRHDPKKREAVICIVSDGAVHEFGTWQIGRDTSGKCVSLTDPGNTLSFQSWIIDSLDRAVNLRKTLGRPVPAGVFKEALKKQGLFKDQL